MKKQKLMILKLHFVPWRALVKKKSLGYKQNLMGEFFIEYKGKKFFFACDTGYGEIYKYLGKKYGPIDLSFINIGAANFIQWLLKKINLFIILIQRKLLKIGQDLKSKKIIGMHWGTVVLSLEPIMEPGKRFKNSSNQYGYHSDDAIIFKIGQLENFRRYFTLV